MRLLNVHTFQFKEYHSEPPPYVITSHRWGEDELTYQDVVNDTYRTKAGFQKVKGFCDAVKEIDTRGRRDNCPRLEWVWIDTCCINKPDFTEFSEAINSMFRWYQESAICLAYLSDVVLAQEDELDQSVWFTRGWTLQELLAPKLVALLDREWEPIGHKASVDAPNWFRTQAVGRQDNYNLARITGIRQQVLEDFSTAKNLSFQERLSWMENRTTTRIEDMAYCQLGIFGVFMTFKYGEREGALTRLYRKIEREALANGQTPWSQEAANTRTDPTATTDSVSLRRAASEVTSPGASIDPTALQIERRATSHATSPQSFASPSWSQWPWTRSAGSNSEDTEVRRERAPPRTQQPTPRTGEEASLQHANARQAPAPSAPWTTPRTRTATTSPELIDPRDSRGVRSTMDAPSLVDAITVQPSSTRITRVNSLSSRFLPQNRVNVHVFPYPGNPEPQPPDFHYNVSPTARFADLKAALERDTGIAARRQRLWRANGEQLRDGAHIASISLPLEIHLRTY